MHALGLTGGIGSGKSTVARLFQNLGVHAVDADDVARQVVEPGTSALSAIADHFGNDILSKDGSLNRAALRELVFQDEGQRVWLERLLHPIIRDELERQLQPQNYALPYVLLVSPLLLETDQHELVERIIVVDVPVEVQIHRTVERDQNSKEQVQRIIDAQIDRDGRCSRADHIIHNDEPLGSVEQQVTALHQQLLASFD